MSDDDMDYDLEYESEVESEDDEIVDIQNKYFDAKALIENDIPVAIEAFQEVLNLEQEKGDWGFKSLKQITKLNLKLGKKQEAFSAYQKMLTYVKSAVTRNYSEKVITSILDLLSASVTSSSTSTDSGDFLQQFYETTLRALEEAKNDRLWFKTTQKLGALYFDKEEYNKVAKIVKSLMQTCMKEDGVTVDMKKGTQLLEVYSLEIQLYNATKNNKKLKEVYQKSLQVKSAIPHPRITAIIRECGGKMHMAEGQWETAYTDFFEAFKNYDEAGSRRRIQALKYVVLANMLATSTINPFESAEARPYKSDPEITAFMNLVTAYSKNDIREFEHILKVGSRQMGSRRTETNEAAIMGDSFVRLYIEDLLKNIRTQVLLQLVEPYTRITIPFISKELNIPMGDVEQLLVSLILDRKITAQIDQVNQMVLLHQKTLKRGIRNLYEPIQKWSSHLQKMTAATVDKISS